MIIMQLQNIAKSFGAIDILKNINIEIKQHDKIAIVGRNGTGKSTLLKIIAGELNYEAGNIYKRKDIKIGYLPQHSKLESNQTIWEEMIEVFVHLQNQEKELRNMEQSMQEISQLNEIEYQALLKEYDQLQVTFENSGGYQYKADIQSVLTGLDFNKDMYDIHIDALSGGQKTRLSLAKLLLQQPDLLILDEPTNHLDIATMSWLENYLASYKGAILVVSHDRYFLEKTVTIIYEITSQHSKKYVGSYQKFLEQRKSDYEKLLKTYEQQQTEIKKMENFIQRNIVRASTTKRAQSRRKQLEKMDRIERPDADTKSASFSFEIEKQSGNDVLRLEDIAFRYQMDEPPLFSHVNLHINRGERVALVGPNGIGKTTILKIILGKLQPSSGTAKLGTNIKLGYYDQEQATLSSSKTVLQELWDDYPLEDERTIRTILGNFLFSGDDVLQPVHSLSGGEKARLALAKLMMKKANFLILDEPTNHLDMDSKEVLEAVLIDFSGTILFVSHDRYFINKIADKVVEMNKDKVKLYLGDYDYYIEKKTEEAEILKLENKDITITQKNDAKQRFEQEKIHQREERKKKREISKLEEEIAVKEEELAQLELEMTKPEVFNDHEKALEHSNQAEAIKHEISQLMEQWEKLHL